MEAERPTPELAPPAGERQDQFADLQRDFTIALVLGGGNALGAYQAGAYQAMHQRRLRPDWVAGASAGAINGAIISGNPEERRLSALESLWRPAAGAASAQPASALEEARRSAAAIWTFAAGRPGLFAPRHSFQRWWNPLGNPEPASIYDTTPMRGTLNRLLDFDLLNRQVPRFSATAVDIETGEDVIFDNTAHRITADHIRASAALVPAFAPVDIGGRMLCDAGLSANLPFDNIFSESHDRPLLCIAMDLLPLHAVRPRTLGEAVIRAQDLMFATQSRRAIAAWQALFDERLRHGAASSVTLLHIAYSDQQREVSGKAFDFSGPTVAARWQAGAADLGAALDDLASGRIQIGQPGMSVYALSKDRSALKPVHWRLEAAPG